MLLRWGIIHETVKSAQIRFQREISINIIALLARFQGQMLLLLESVLRANLIMHQPLRDRKRVLPVLPINHGLLDTVDMGLPNLNLIVVCRNRVGCARCVESPLNWIATRAWTIATIPC
ncbi:gp9 [Mycobacterium phage Konstantine]|uniref:Uncharacterized protein n=1 Tax=Mycobacterium phage Konstantine TaxID=563121 RepID=B5U4X9_9CAUD|nr:gp9 [Mycobacterium phage Konstantine]ACI12425.1 hypothetical protein KONSTANTINE_9 [Mycobacterium phage Konstantine]